MAVWQVGIFPLQAYRNSSSGVAGRRSVWRCATIQDLLVSQAEYARSFVVLQACGDRPPPLVEVACAFAASPVLAPLLRNGPSVQDADMEQVCLDAIDAEGWAAHQHLGSRCATHRMSSHAVLVMPAV